MEKIVLLKTFGAIALGGGIGFAYYKLIGCSSGTCAITSNPWASTIYGAVFGFLISFSK